MAAQTFRQCILLLSLSFVGPFLPGISFAKEETSPAAVLIRPEVGTRAPSEEETNKPGELKNPLLDEKQKFEAIEEQDDFQIFRHKPIYFAYSNPLTKVQLSFRSSLIETWPLFFGYTQVIFWKLGEESKPFLDATYNPEFFYRITMAKKTLKSVDIGFWEHNSNGKDNSTSRSFDQAYVKANHAFEFKNWLLTTTTKISYIYNNDETNADILNYIGPVDLQFSFIQLYSGVIDKSTWSLSMHPGGKWANKWENGGYELSYSFRLGGVKVVPSFYLQYFRGYGETLLTYNTNEEQFRAGLLF
jgi:outer membrane phospholipase A